MMFKFYGVNKPAVPHHTISKPLECVMGTTYVHANGRNDQPAASDTC